MEQTSQQVTDLREKLNAHMEQYRNDHFWDNYPAGNVSEWVLDAFEKFMKQEIENLKVTNRKKTLS